MGGTVAGQERTAIHPERISVGESAVKAPWFPGLRVRRPSFGGEEGEGAGKT